MVESIEHLLLNEHKRMINLLKEALKNIKHSPLFAEEFFIKFKWNLEKHFFMEEKTIFSNPAIENSEHSEEIEYILNEHKEILNFIKSIEENKDGLKENEFLHLIKLVEKHAQYEDEDFYPRLDEVLTAKQKSIIISESRKILQP